MNTERCINLFSLIFFFFFPFPILFLPLCRFGWRGRRRCHHCTWRIQLNVRRCALGALCILLLAQQQRTRREPWSHVTFWKRSSQGSTRTYFCVLAFVIIAIIIIIIIIGPLLQKPRTRCTADIEIIWVFSILYVSLVSFRLKLKAIRMVM